VRRFVVVIGATGVGLAGVLGFHSRGTAPAPSATPSASAPGSPASTGNPAGTTTVPSRASRTSRTSLPTATTGPPPTAAAAPPQVASATGASEQYGYGALSVRVTVSGSKITAATVATLQTAESYSQQLAQQAIPLLRREVLATQTARISGISGATYTSEAYAASVQSALDKLHGS
jgi:uncharacterized protein with FMN-binding domain